MIHFFPSRVVALELFGFPIHWYGLMYLAAFLAAFYLLPRLQKHRGLSLSRDEWATLLSWAVIGVLAGGRLGFVLFYEPAYFLKNPLEVVQVWHGGMSSHGGFLGVTLALLYTCRKLRIHPLALADTLAVPVAIGLAFGRMGNFINEELYGTVTAVPWAMEFSGAEGLRHPTQIYAIFKDLFIAAVCFWHLRRRPAAQGKTMGLMLMLYGALRFIVEHFREQPYDVLALGSVVFTRGQLLTIPLFLAGLYLWMRRQDRVA